VSHCKKANHSSRAFNIGEFVNSTIQQPLPEPIQKDEPTIGSFMDGCHHLCLRILELLAQGLRIPDSAGGKRWFSDCHDRGEVAAGSILRLLYYPSMPASPDGESDIRAGAHSDYGSVTLLFRLPGQPGLEILTPSGNSWAPVPVNPNNEGDSPILVNIGDMLSYWTGGFLKSTVHRVIFPKDADGGGVNDRYSIAYFCHPRHDTKLVEIPSPVIQDHMAKHKGEDVNIGMGVGKLEEGTVLTAKSHLERRLAATYGAKQQGGALE
jgi:isopenicillin N synthase-like dioxygenase